MRTLNNKMNQVADRVGLTRLGEALEHNGYLIAFAMFLNGNNVYYNEELEELLNDLLTPLNY